MNEELEQHDCTFSDQETLKDPLGWRPGWLRLPGPPDHKKTFTFKSDSCLYCKTVPVSGGPGFAWGLGRIGLGLIGHPNKQFDTNLPTQKSKIFSDKEIKHFFWPRIKVYGLTTQQIYSLLADPKKSVWAERTERV